jgi:isopentenyldiphosphate isomerase
MGELVERVDEQDRVLEVVERAEAVRRRWMHRIATTICRDPTGRILVLRRAEGHVRFPEVVERGPFVPGGREALRRCLGHSPR